MNDNLSNTLKKIRREIFLTAVYGNTGHLASSFSVVEILYALYFNNVLKYDSSNPKWINRDRLIVSKGHCSLAMYVTLQKAGFFDESYLHSFCHKGSTLGGEANPLHVPGVEAATGSLGQGLPYAVGIALSNKSDNKANKTYVIVGDGECQEGSIWEAAVAASRYKLDNLTVILDCNKMQKMSTTDKMMGKVAWREKWEAFGFQVSEVDGHDVNAITSILLSLENNGMPHLIIANTVKGKGVTIMENNPSWHWRLPTQQELGTVLADLDITTEEYNLCSKRI